ncbi:MAG: TetR/AcrR family transcriptional regulator [Actinomycetota bacterium]
MSNVDSTAVPADGRAARRQRNIDAALDVVLELFAEDAMFPTIEQVAKRSGLSLRSLYRYFADPGELLEAAIRRGAQQSREASRIHGFATGPLDTRIAEFVAMRVRLWELRGAVLRATLANAARHPRVRHELAARRTDMRIQFEQQFERELSAMKGADREAVAAAGDLLTQMESVDFLRRHRQLTAEETRASINTALRALFT